MSLSLSGAYSNGKNSSSSLAATFNEDPGELTRKMLEAIYSDGSSEKIETIINRSATMTDGWNKNWGASVAPTIVWELPSTQDRLMLGLFYSFSSQKQDLWKDYNITYGNNPANSEILRQYFDNSPNKNNSVNISLRYSTTINKVYLGLGYSYRYENVVKDSYMYALDHLNDMGVYGVLPSDYLLSLDPNNSYKSEMWQNVHRFNPNINYYTRWDNSALSFYLDGSITLNHRKFSYWRNNKDYQLSKTNVMVSLPYMYSARLSYYFGKYGDERNYNFRNQLMYGYIIDPTLPDMFDMVDVVNDADPLNIYYGNPNLKTAVRHRQQAWWFYKPESIKLRNDFSISYTTVHNALTRGYTYDTFTGVRYNKMYNVDGQRTFAISDNIEWQFGKNLQFTLSYGSDTGFSRETDMIGVNMESPEETYVHNFTTNQRFKFSWSLGKQNISVRCDWINRHTTSTQEGFNTLNANHINAGVSGVFVLPAGFGISTDFMCYTRRGYGVSYLDTTDPVWNLRVTYAPPRNNHWVFMLDGFDMLHQLSNVNYAVTASGRTISYTNSIPRYIMLSIQYRLNIQPKKR